MHKRPCCCLECRLARVEYSVRGLPFAEQEPFSCSDTDPSHLQRGLSSEAGAAWRNGTRLNVLFNQGGPHLSFHSI